MKKTFSISRIGAAGKALATFVQSRAGFYALMVALLTIKSWFAYVVDFNHLHINSPFQVFLAIINPIGFTMVIFALPLFFKRRQLFYGASLILQTACSIFLYVTVVYFREFTDFLTVNTILNYGAANQGAKAGGAVSLGGHDFLYFLDIVVVILLLVFKKIRMDSLAFKKSRAFLYLSLGWLLLMANLALADIDRPQLLTRQFDREYLVKYLGIGPFTVLDAYNTAETSQVRHSAKPEDIRQVRQYLNQNFAGANPVYEGQAKGKNVIVIHLESFQQLSIDRKINGKEVTPFLNSLYHSKDSLSFDNFFHQVGQGKTSDAENMLETSTFGLPQGSLFAKLGSDQVFQAMPAILNQRAGYSSAVFHGNNGSFWNRANVYRSMGYQNWISGEYFDVTGKKATAWGLKDKLLFKDSVPYLERLQQPFYAKYLTVSNHIPYEIDKQDQDPNFQTTNSGSKFIDNYFVTNHYLDQAVEEFFNYLKKSGLYDNTTVVLYGDHYGINNSESKELAPLVGKNPRKWTDLDSLNQQRVPLIIHSPGLKNGGIQHNYGGEIDVAPTLEHLLGISNKRYIQFGQDLLSKQRRNVVAFRNKDWITADYASISGTIWDVKTDQKITDPTASQQKRFDAIQNEVNQQLAMSDAVNQKNLLRFYHPEGFTQVDASKVDYSKQHTIKRLKKGDQKDHSHSLFQQNGRKTTINDYQTDAPEEKDQQGQTTRVLPRGSDDLINDD
ncbi:LTA synthase family protein [Leuconostocaceae bacterium ESL0958]|nr:LTA synthase family protein [Leuconostocaceae bacterium ESL0958]